MSAVADTIATLEGLLGFKRDEDEPTMWRARLLARPEPGNDRQQELQVHVISDQWHEGIVLRSIAGLVSNTLALSLMSAWRDKYGSLEYQKATDETGFLSLVTHIPLAPFSLSDPQAIVNFISEFIGRADTLEESLLDGADHF